jgi:drug/metabolite transporter (DMT)-like permease
LQTYGLRFVTPDTSAFLTSLSVLMVPLGEWAVHRRRPPTRILAAVVVAACGVWLLLAPSGAWNVGAWLTLGCAVAFAGQILATHGVERPDIVGFTVVELGVVGVASTVGWLMVVPAPHLSAPPSAWEAAALLAVLATALAFVGQTWAQTHTTPSRAALIFTLEPWFAVLVTALVTHHGLAAAAWLGAVLTFGAVALAEWGSRAASA